MWKDDWKCLIILDACRYDYFKKVYKDYLSGRLEKVYSPGSETREWLEKVFKDKRCDDTVYISANPFINSKGIPHGSFDPRKCLSFYKIIDVWDWGWSEEMGTVHPKEVNKAALVATRLYKDKKFIIHYMQPHAPYLILHPKHVYSFSDLVKGYVRRRIRYMFGRKWFKFVNKLIGTSPGYEKLVAKKFGIECLRQAYEKNLRIVLSHVAGLIKHLRGKIIITTDHGELLGEQGLYGHPQGKSFPELREVPWLEIEKI